MVGQKWLQAADSIQLKLAIIFLLLIILAIQLIGVYYYFTIENYFVSNLKRQLHSQSSLLYDRVRDILEDKTLSNLQRQRQLNILLGQLFYFKKVDKSTPTVLVQVVDTNGFVIGSTNKKGEYGTREQFLMQPNSARDYFYALKDGKRYLTIPKTIKSHDGKLLGTIYTEASLDETYNTVTRLSKVLMKKTIVALFITGLLVLILTRTITNPIQEITKQATAMAEGNFDQKVEVKSQDEIGKLAAAFNHLTSQLKKALAQKEEERGKLESVLANMNDGVIATDQAGKVMVYNHQSHKLLGQTFTLGVKLQDLLPLEPPLELPLKEERQELLEKDHERQDKNYIIKATFSPLTLSEREEIGVLTILEDTTEQEHLDKQRKDFVANVSHELRTPLTTIKSYLESIDDDLIIQDPKLTSRFLKVALQEAERMTRLIQDLLQLSRLDAKQSTWNTKLVYLDEILEDAWQHFNIPCTQKGVNLILYSPPPLSCVYVDRDKMIQVLDNLLSNAFKYTSPGGAIAIVKRLKDENLMEICISDTGYGIPAQDLNRIFERFYRVDKARSRNLGGTGLGLAIAKEIIESSGGEINITSILGRGTTVSCTIPSLQGGDLNDKFDMEPTS